MIIKSLSRKKPSFFQLYDYMLDGADDKDFIIAKNIYKAGARKDVLRQFNKNYALLPKRKNGNALYHEIISLPQQDISEIPIRKQKEILYTIANSYLEKRVGLNLCFGVIHEEKDHLHCHLMISSNEKQADKRYRLEKSDLARIQKEMEIYKQERFPELEDKVLYNKERTKNKYQSSQSKDRENQFKHRKKEPSRKDQLKQIITEAILDSYSTSQLQKKLKKQNLEFYQRGKTAGIIDLEAKAQGKTKHKHRFKTLDLEQEYQNLLEFDKSREQDDFFDREMDDYERD